MEQILELINWIMNHWELILTGASIAGAVYKAYEARGLKGALEVVITEIGHNKESNKELKKNIEKKAGRRGLAGFLDKHVKRLKKNHTVKTIGEIAKDVFEDSLKKRLLGKLA